MGTVVTSTYGVADALGVAERVGDSLGIPGRRPVAQIGVRVPRSSIIRNVPTLIPVSVPSVPPGSARNDSAT